uniref:Natterin-3-like n=1 Tax=Rhabditophanes sp. KR3021 TaxID=114890 RepID=A0AC35UDL2_9BILA
MKLWQGLLVFCMIGCFQSFKLSDANRINDILITTQVSSHDYNSLYENVIPLWMKTNSNSVYIVGDVKDEAILSDTNGHFIPSNCGAYENNLNRNCKVQIELETMVQLNNPWSCHVNAAYNINMQKLRQLFTLYNPETPHIFSMTTIEFPIKIKDKADKQFDGVDAWCVSRGALNNVGDEIKRGTLMEFATNFDTMDYINVAILFEITGQVKSTKIANFYIDIELLAATAFPANYIFTGYANPGYPEHYLNIPNSCNIDENPLSLASINCYINGINKGEIKYVPPTEGAPNFVIVNSERKKVRQ